MPQGKLFYLMGASGVGKDSLLNYLQKHLPPDAPVALARRFITRPASVGGEQHVPLSRQAFQEKLTQGGFAMHWHSHGFDYGIDCKIDRQMEVGIQIVVNGSRHYLDRARQRYPDLCPVLITVSQDQLLQRLLARGRESGEEIERRLQRAKALDGRLDDQTLIRLSNDDALENAGERLLELVMQSVRASDRSHPASV